MFDKSKAITEFLKSLEDGNNTSKLFEERLDNELFMFFNKYAEIIMEKRENIILDDRELITSSMIVGYLIKSFLDRYELEKTLSIS
jgi:hypothetical protein